MCPKKAGDSASARSMLCYAPRAHPNFLAQPVVADDLDHGWSAPAKQTHELSRSDARAALPRGTKETKGNFTLRAMKEPEYRLEAYIGVFF